MPNRYRFTARAAAQVIFKPEEEIGIAIGGSQNVLKFVTRYIDGGFSVPFPGDMEIIAQVSAESLEDALNEFVTEGRRLAQLLSVASNAVIERFKPEIIWQADENVERRAFLQSFMPGDALHFSSRIMPVDQTIELIGLVGNHPERERLERAATQYYEALLRWEHGSEIVALEHLWMGAEALKVVAWRNYAQERGLEPEQLAEEWGFKEGLSQKVFSFLDGEARRRLVFQGNDIHHKIAKQVSDSFEHGFPFEGESGDWSQSARDVLVPTAQYVREAILRLCGLSEASTNLLLAEPYCRQRGPGGIDQIVRGTLVGLVPHPGPTEDQPPHCEWKHGLEAVWFDDQTQRYNFRPKGQLTWRMAKGIDLTDLRYEMWDAGTNLPPFVAGKKSGN